MADLLAVADPTHSTVDELIDLILSQCSILDRVGCGRSRRADVNITGVVVNTAALLRQKLGAIKSRTLGAGAESDAEGS